MRGGKEDRVAKRDGRAFELRKELAHISLKGRSRN